MCSNTAEGNCGWVRSKIAEAGLTDEIEAEAQAIAEARLELSEL
jgi:hypothetical protein